MGYVGGTGSGRFLQEIHVTSKSTSKEPKTDRHQVLEPGEE